MFCFHFLAREILIEADLRQRGVGRCDIVVYLDGKLIGSYFDRSYNDLPGMANELRTQPAVRLGFGDAQFSQCRRIGNIV